MRQLLFPGLAILSVGFFQNCFAEAPIQDPAELCRTVSKLIYTQCLVPGVPLTMNHVDCVSNAYFKKLFTFDPQANLDEITYGVAECFASLEGGQTYPNTPTLAQYFVCSKIAKNTLDNCNKQLNNLRALIEEKVDVTEPVLGSPESAPDGSGMDGEVLTRDR